MTRPLLPGAAALVLVAALTTLEPPGRFAGALDVELLLALLEAAAAALAVVVGLLCLVRWRLVGEAASLWLGIGLILYGAVTVAAGALFPRVLAEPSATEPLLWARPASRVIVLACFLAAVMWPQVDSRLRLGGLVLGVAGATLVVAVLLRAAPHVAALLAGGADAMPGVERGTVGPTVVALSWAGLTAVYLLRGARQRRLLFAWVGLCFLGLSLAELSRLVTLGSDHVPGPGSSVMRVLGLLCALAGATAELRHAHAAQSARLAQSVMSFVTAEARLAAGEQESEERAHEMRNALTAVAGATTTLERFQHELDADTRSQLSAAVVAEVARLQHLISRNRVDHRDEVFDVAAAIEAVVAAARADGLEVVARVPSGLCARGRAVDVAQVVQNLLENVRRHAPGSPVEITGREEARGVILAVADRGPGVAPEDRDAVFGRGVRGSSAVDVPGSGLGLFVSRRLLRQRGGDLHLEPRPGGGAVFVVVLAAPTTSDQRTTAGSDHAAQGVEGERRQRSGPGNPRHGVARPGSPLREPDDDPGADGRW